LILPYLFSIFVPIHPTENRYECESLERYILQQDNHGKKSKVNPLKKNSGFNEIRTHGKIEDIYLKCNTCGNTPPETYKIK